MNRHWYCSLQRGEEEDQVEVYRVQCEFDNEILSDEQVSIQLNDVSRMDETIEDSLMEYPSYCSIQFHWTSTVLTDHSVELLLLHFEIYQMN